MFPVVILLFGAEHCRSQLSANRPLAASAPHHPPASDEHKALGSSASVPAAPSESFAFITESPLPPTFSCLIKAQTGSSISSKATQIIQNNNNRRGMKATKLKNLSGTFNPSVSCFFFFFLTVMHITQSRSSLPRQSLVSSRCRPAVHVPPRSKVTCLGCQPQRRVNCTGPGAHRDPCLF